MPTRNSLLAQRGRPSGTLVVQPWPGIGDMIWHLRHIHAIAAASPEGQVTLLTKPRSKADRLLAADSAVGQVLWLHRNPGHHDGPRGLFALARLLRAQRFHTVWILHGSFRYGFAAWLAGISARYGFGNIRQRVFLNRPPLPLPGGKGRQAIDAADHLLQLNGVPFLSEEPRLPVMSESRESIHASYGELEKPWIVLGIGGSEPSRQWGQENYARLIAELCSSGRGSMFLLGGGPAETEMANWIGERLGESRGRVEDAVGLSIEDSIALIAQSSLYVGNNTGFLNVAAALGVEAIGLFGGSRPLTYSRRIHHVLPAKSNGAMSDITVEQVLTKIDSICPHTESRAPSIGRPAGGN